MRELEHLADTARKVRDQAAAELTRGSGAAHHIARERIAAAERMLRKAQQEMAELRAQLAQPVTGIDAAETTITSQDFELAVLLGHNKGRFNQVGGAHAPLELQQDTAHGRQGVGTSKEGARHPQTYATTKSSMSGKRTWTFGLLLVVGLGLGAFGTYAMLNHSVMTDATQLVRDGTVQLIIRLRALLPTTDASGHTTAKAAFSAADNPHRRQPI
ncbi:MAG: hypothetical protein HZB57_06225 [Gammaproteobacteria bacterium]|nr:hypothetical protein [Gammaproteobacteria bacterium]